MIEVIRVTYTDVPPMRPNDADYGVKINFTRGASDPVATFNSMVLLLEGFKEIDRLLIGAASSDLRPVMVLEDVEEGSFISWVRNRFEDIDDQALKEFSPKQQLGKYAVKGKYKIIEYLNKREAKTEYARLQRLRRDLHALASEVAVPNKLSIPGYIDLDQLAGPMDQIQEAKQLLLPSDKASVIVGAREKKLELGVTKKPSEFLEPPPATVTSSGNAEMVLLIRKPDYLGDSLWEFRHGPTRIDAHILDTGWLDRFRSGQINLVPGSALACFVSYSYGYDKDGELVAAKFDIKKVHRTVPPGGATGDLFG